MRIREFMGADFEPLSKILGESWHARHEDHAFWHGADELCFHLSKTDKGFVCEDEDGSVVGVILLTSPDESDSNDTLRMHWLQQRTRLAAMASALGVNARADVAFLNEEDALMNEVANSLGTEGVGVVQLLILEAGHKGKGFGGSLLSAGRDWLKSRGATKLRLVTDDECDWQFYEHLGFSRVIEKEYMFVYEAQL